MSTPPSETSSGQISDGYHTFDELYEHRCLLFIGLMQAHPARAWRATHHDDGSGDSEWWIAGLDLPTGPVTYHLPGRHWPLLDSHPIRTLEKAPPWDGHSSQDVLEHLTRWLRTAPTQA